MDNSTLNHLDKWLKNSRSADEQEKLKRIIVAFIEQYPDLIIDHSWPEIEMLATRKL